MQPHRQPVGLITVASSRLTVCSAAWRCIGILFVGPLALLPVKVVAHRGEIHFCCLLRFSRGGGKVEKKIEAPLVAMAQVYASPGTGRRLSLKEERKKQKADENNRRRSADKARNLKFL